MSASKLESTDIENLHDIEKICQVCGADPCYEPNWSIRKRNSNETEDITKPHCNCCKCIKCPVSVIKRLCQLAMKNEERQNVSKERYSVFEGGRSLDFDQKPQVDERGDFIYKRKSKPLDSSSDDFKSSRGRASSKEMSRRKFSTDGDSYYTSPDRKSTKKKRNTRDGRTNSPTENDNTTLTSEKGEKSEPTRKMRRKPMKKTFYSTETSTEDASSAVGKSLNNRKHQRLTGGETSKGSNSKQNQKPKKVDKLNDLEKRQIKEETSHNEREDDMMDSSKESRLNGKGTQEDRVEKDSKRGRTLNTVTSEDDKDSRIKAGEGLHADQKNRKLKKQDGVDKKEKITKNEPIRRSKSDVNTTDDKKRKNSRKVEASKKSEKEMESDITTQSEKRIPNKPKDKQGIVNRNSTPVDKSPDNFGSELSKRESSKKSSKNTTKEEDLRKSYSNRTPVYSSKISEEVITDSKEKNKRSSKIPKDIPVYNHEDLQKPKLRKQPPNFPSPYAASPPDKFRRSVQSPNSPGKKLTTKRKRSVEDKLKIIETLTPDLVRPQERDEKGEIKSKAGRFEDTNIEGPRDKARKFRIPGYRSSMEGLGRGCRKLKSKLGVTRYDQFAVSDLMRMRLEAEDMRRTRPVSNNAGNKLTPKCTAMNLDSSCVMNPRVHNLQINDACLPPPINPLAYCYL